MKVVDNIRNWCGRNPWWAQLCLGGLPGVTFAILFARNIGQWLFNPELTTDDASQQIFPFWEVLYPGRFSGDLIYEVMRGYLAPLHWWIGVVITKLTHDPVMTGHWMNVLQLGLAGGCLFLAVRNRAHWVAGVAAVVWFLHTRPVIQRITAGLPRGWSAVMLAAFLWQLSRGSHRGTLLVILLAAFTNPPVSAILGLAYGIYCVWKLLGVASPLERRQAFGRCWQTALFGIVLVVVLSQVTSRPSHIGSMVGPREVPQIEDLSVSGGRFPFYPQPSIGEHLRDFGFEAFFSRRIHAVPVLGDQLIKDKDIVMMVIFGVVVVLLFRSARRGESVAREVSLLLAISIVYLLSRQFIFKLYVPDRHLQIPMALWFITTVPVLLAREWGLLSSRWREHLNAVPHLFLALFVFACSGSGLEGVANFNYQLRLSSGIYTFLRTQIPENALVAGEPTQMDRVPLTTQRRTYLTWEAYHPFYPTYLREMKRRFAVVMQAQFSASPAEFHRLLAGEGITHFVFDRAAFRQQRLEKPRDYGVLKPIVQEAAAQRAGISQGAFEQLRSFASSNPKQKHPVVPYIDSHHMVVDVAALGLALQSKIL